LKANTVLWALLICLPLSTLAQHSHGAQTPYAGMQNRAIKSLSDNDINELRRGGGWGLALAAELNGMPGPAHLLELKDQIPLAPDQVAKTQVLLDEMRRAAIPTGERLIAAEKALEAAFAAGKVDESSLRPLAHRHRVGKVGTALHPSFTALQDRPVPKARADQALQHPSRLRRGSVQEHPRWA
jgi:hypothetical protein